MTNPISSLFRLLLLTASISAYATDKTVSEIDLEVWSALVNHGLGEGVAIVVIAEQTSGDAAALGGAEDISAVIEELGAPAEVWANWLQRNRHAHDIEGALDLTTSYQILSRDAREKLFQNAEPQASWAQFFERYPGAPGLLRLSRAGLGSRLQHAVVYVEYQCGAECGSGRLIYLSNPSGDKWQVQGAALVWLTDSAAVDE